MAELSKDPKFERRFFDIFCPAYNVRHGTAYTGDPVSQEHKLWDYRWPSPLAEGASLDVQHTVAGSDPDRERVQFKNICEIHDELQRRLQTLGIQGYSAGLDWESVPKNSLARADLVDEVWEILKAGLMAGLPPGETAVLHRHWAYDSNDHLPTIDVACHGQATPTGLMGIDPGWIEDAAARLTAAVSAKIEKLSRRRATADVSKIILAVDLDLYGYEPDDVSAMQAAAQGVPTPYAEVWAVDLSERTRADYLWP